MTRCPSVFSLLLVLAACGDAAEPSTPPSPPPTAECAEDEAKQSDGTCMMQASTAACPSGTRPAVGTTECPPVGPTSCASGFTRDASGWGCAAVLPPTPASCTGATRPELGSTTCVSVGDCGAAFPPANAIIVDPDAPVDATHVKTIADALVVAPAGGVVALVDGTHSTDALTTTKAVTLVGRCAEKARVVASPTATSGFSLRAKTALRGLTIASFPVAISAQGSFEVAIDEVVIDGARTRALFPERGASVVVRRSVIRGTAPASGSEQTVAVLVGSGAKVRLEESAILGSIDGAVVATDSGESHVEIVRSVVADTKARADKKGGAALRAFEGARLDVTESAILGSTGSAVLAFRRNKPPPSVTVKRSVITQTSATIETGNAIGTAINAAYEAKVRVEESTISDSEGTGVYVAEKARVDLVKSVVVRSSRTKDFSAHAVTALKEGTASLEDSAVVRSGGLGVGGWERGRATLLRSLVRDIGGDVVEGLPMGQGMNVHSGSVIEATDSAIVDAQEIAASATKPGSAIRLDRVILTRSDGAPAPRFGHGLLSVDSARIDATRSIVERFPGVAIFGASGSGVLSSSLVRDNAVAVHVQEGSTLTEVDAVPDVVGEAELVVATSTRFTNNASRNGSGVMPLPGVLGPP